MTLDLISASPLPIRTDEKLGVILIFTWRSAGWVVPKNCCIAALILMILSAVLPHRMSGGAFSNFYCEGSIFHILFDIFFETIEFFKKLLTVFVGAKKHLLKWICPSDGLSVASLHFRRHRRASLLRVARNCCSSCFRLKSSFLDHPRMRCPNYHI